MLQTTQGALTVVNAHMPNPSVFWNGILVQGVKSLVINNTGEISHVVLTLVEDLAVAEMQAAGIIIRRK